MFRFTVLSPRTLVATTALVALSTAAHAQMTSSGAPGQTRARRSISRQNRIARNIQDAYSHRWEVGGGLGYLRFRTGENLQRVNMANWFMSPTYNLNPRWSVAGDIRGYYGSANIPNVYVLNKVNSPKISQYTFTAGPQYRLLADEKYSISVNAEAGIGMSKFGGDAKGLPSQLLGMWPDSNARPVFSVSLIGDYNIYNNFAVRVQPTYLGTTWGGTVQNNLGVEAGVVYRFGRQK
jgi:hypothetical protein